MNHSAQDVAIEQPSPTAHARNITIRSQNRPFIPQNLQFTRKSPLFYFF